MKSKDSQNQKDSREAKETHELSAINSNNRSENKD